MRESETIHFVISVITINEMLCDNIGISLYALPELSYMIVGNAMPAYFISLGVLSVFKLLQFSNMVFDCALEPTQDKLLKSRVVKELQSANI